MSTFLFGTKGLGQKHSRLEHERVARAQDSLFFPIFASASSSTGRADVKIKRKSSQKRNAEKEISLVATSDQGSAFGNRKLPKKFDQNFPVTLRQSFDLSLHNKILAFSVPMRRPRKLPYKNSKQQSYIKATENEPKLL